MVRIEEDHPVVVGNGFVEAAHCGAGFRPLEIQRRVALVKAVHCRPASSRRAFSHGFAPAMLGLWRMAEISPENAIQQALATLEAGGMTTVREWKDAMNRLRTSGVFDETSGLVSDEQRAWAKKVYEMLNLRVACCESASNIRSKL